MTCSSKRLDELWPLMGEAQQRGDMEEFRRLGAEVSEIVHSPEMNRKVAQLLMSAAYYAVGEGEAAKLRAENKRLRAQLAKRGRNG